MSTHQERPTRNGADASMDFATLLAGVRALQPTCVDCGVALQAAVTGVRFRLSDEGKKEALCRACAVSEIGEALLESLPR